MKKAFIYYQTAAIVTMTISILILVLQYWIMKTVNAEHFSIPEYQQKMMDEQNAMSPDTHANIQAGAFIGLMIVLLICIATGTPPEE